MLEFIKAQGYRVFVSKLDNPVYCYYSDGVHIAYAQWDRCSFGVHTVHKPCHECGTGFVYSKEITAETLRAALNAYGPHWAGQRDINAVRKYADIDAFLKAPLNNIVKLIEV